MHNLYSMCILSVLSVGYIHDVKAHPIGVQCGTVTHGRRKPRILNGTVAEENEFPWIASVQRDGLHMCGGTIISARYVLSAAHCFDEFSTYKNWSITLGDHSKTVNEPFSVSYGIKRKIAHSGYGVSNNIIENDIVLLELNDDIQWTDHIQPICLPTDNNMGNNVAIAAGWGADHVTQGLTNNENSKLRYVKMNIFENDQCNNIYKRENLGISLKKTHMCAGHLHEIRDTNHGDSGGPLLVKLNGRQVLVGITSTGTKESIFPKSPGIYTRVFEFMGWIMEHIHEVVYYPPVLTNKLE